MLGFDQTQKLLPLSLLFSLEEFAFSLELMTLAEWLESFLAILMA
jgi:hypothetical protein